MLTLANVDKKLLTPNFSKNNRLWSKMVNSYSKVCRKWSTLVKSGRRLVERQSNVGKKWSIFVDFWS
jgi:hypothetical protein